MCTGSAACHFIVLGRRIFFFLFFLFSQSSSFLLSGSSLSRPRPSPHSWFSETSEQSESEEKERAQPQFDVSSLSRQPPVLLLVFTFLPAWCFFFSAHLLCRCLVFSFSRRRLSFCLPGSLFPYSVSIWLCGGERLCMCVTANQQGCGYQRLPAAATTPWAVPAKRRR